MSDLHEILDEHIGLFCAIRGDESFLNCLKQVADVIAGVMEQHGKLMICGNGGSAADAQHMAAEFLGRFAFDSRPLPAITLTSDTSTLTCVSNDYSYDEIFARQVEGLGKSDDILLCISTSGTSPNILRALEVARHKNIASVLLTSERLPSDDIADLIIKVPSENTARIQEMHIFIIHFLCGYVEKRICGME